jgi:hypothetical protein
MLHKMLLYPLEILSIRCSGAIAPKKSFVLYKIETLTEQSRIDKYPLEEMLKNVKALASDPCLNAAPRGSCTKDSMTPATPIRIPPHSGELS